MAGVVFPRALFPAREMSCTEGSISPRPDDSMQEGKPCEVEGHLSYARHRKLAHARLQGGSWKDATLS